jgi:small multidrug resistance family-3 protein
MVRTVAVLVLAALLEISGDAFIRIGLGRRYALAVLGALMLVAYGVVVNQSRLDFGRLMGAYIAVFFVVSQIVAFIIFKSVPELKVVSSGLLIIAGGAVIIS